MDVQAIDDLCSRKCYYALAAINIVFAAIIIPENALILMAMYRLSRKRPLQVSYLIIASLAATDLLSGCIPQSIYGYMLATHGYNYAEKDLKAVDSWLLSIMYYSSYMLCGVSLLLVAIMSIACLLAVARPTAYRVNKYRAGIIYAIKGAWLTCSLIPILMFASRNTMVVFICIISGGIVVSLLVIFASYIKVISLTFFRRRTILDELELQSTHIVVSRSQPTSYREKRMIKSFATIAIILVVMYLPQLIIKPLTMIPSKDLYEYLVVLDSFATTLLFCNSFANPFVYAFRHKKIRQTISAMFKNICQKKPDGTSPVTVRAKTKSLETRNRLLDSREQGIFVINEKAADITNRSETVM